MISTLFFNKINSKNKIQFKKLISLSNEINYFLLMWYNINRTGRLGNRLFSRAHIYAAALELGETVIDWGLNDYKNYFPNCAKTKLPIYPLENNHLPNYPNNFLANETPLNIINKLRPRITGKIGNFWNQFYDIGNPEDMRIDTKKFESFCKSHKNIFLNGYKLRCNNWVKKHRNEICKYFKIHNSYYFKWQKLINFWKKEYSEIIGIHMRRGDYKTAIRGNFYLSPDEYTFILKNLVNIDFKKSLIILFSEDRFTDDNEWENLNNSFSFSNFILNNGTILDDLTGLVFCDKIIGPKTSTFSKWAAFYGNKYWAGISRKSLTDLQILEFKKISIPWDY